VVQDFLLIDRFGSAIVAIQAIDKTQKNWTLKISFFKKNFIRGGSASEPSQVLPLFGLEKPAKFAHQDRFATATEMPKPPAMPPRASDRDGSD
jgi:hypothetical protein